MREDPSENDIKEVTHYVKRELGAVDGLLDTLVLDQKHQEGNKINNQGTSRQVKYLLKRMQVDELKVHAKKEMNYIQRHNRALKKGGHR